jgi:hypothetical protein
LAQHLTIIFLIDNHGSASSWPHWRGLRRAEQMAPGAARIGPVRLAERGLVRSFQLIQIFRS